MHAHVLALCLILGPNASYARSVNNAPPGTSQTAEPSLNQLLEQVKSMDEPALRVFLQFKILSYLWIAPSGPTDPDAVENAAKAAFVDLQVHKDEIPALYVDALRRNLLTLINLHNPELAASLTKEYKLDRRTDFEIAYSSLNQKGEVGQAVSTAQRSLASGKDPGSTLIVFFLHKLEKENSAEVSKLLDTIMTAEEFHPGSFSAGTLLSLKHLFIREQTSPELQRRYLSVVINRAGEKNIDLASVSDIYIVLADALPLVEKQLPALYTTAGTRLSELAARMPERTLKRISINKRLSRSSDPLSQLMIEIDYTKDQSLKEALLAEAAPRALEKGQLRTAVDLGIKLKAAAKEDLQWRDQFMEKVVERAVNVGDVEVAKYAAAQIQPSAVHSSALQKIALYFQSMNDFVSARDTLNAARKLIESSESGTDEAAALLDLAGTFMKVDEQQSWEIVRTAVNIINEIPPPSRKESPQSTEHLNDVENMMKIAYRIVPTFQALAARDGSRASTLLEDLRPQGFKLAATVGTQISPLATEKNVASK